MVAEPKVAVEDGWLVVEVDDAEVPAPADGLALASRGGRIVATAVSLR